MAFPSTSRCPHQEVDVLPTITVTVEHFMGDRRPCAVTVPASGTVADVINEFWARNPTFKEQWISDKAILVSVA
jgi:hypothetical protein